MLNSTPYTLKAYTEAGGLFLEFNFNTYEDARNAVEQIKAIYPDFGMFKIQRSEGLGGGEC